MSPSPNGVLNFTSLVVAEEIRGTSRPFSERRPDHGFCVVRGRNFVQISADAEQPLVGILLVQQRSRNEEAAPAQAAPRRPKKSISTSWPLFFLIIHIEISCSGLKSNSMPLPSGSSLRYISPVCFSSSVVAISTENTCTPFLVTISSGWKLAARTDPMAAMTPATMRMAASQPFRSGPDGLSIQNSWGALRAWDWNSPYAAIAGKARGAPAGRRASVAHDCAKLKA